MLYGVEPAQNNLNTCASSSGNCARRSSPKKAPLVTSKPSPGLDTASSRTTNSTPLLKPCPALWQRNPRSVARAVRRCSKTERTVPLRIPYGLFRKALHAAISNGDRAERGQHVRSHNCRDDVCGGDRIHAGVLRRALQGHPDE